MAVTSINPADATKASTSLASAVGSNSDSEQRFLKLLVTQLNNQDPLNPLDNAELTSQLAQMSTVSGIEKLNGALESLLSQSGSAQVLQAAGLIGRSVLVPGQDLPLKQGAPSPFAVELSGAATSVKVSITNAAGEVVRSYDLGGLPQGVKTVSWDGLSDTGAALADGVYKINVTAAGADSSVDAVTLTYANVVSVAQGPNGVALDLADSRKISFGDIRLILSAASASSI